jgi:hypothetical protein
VVTVNMVYIELARMATETTPFAIRLFVGLSHYPFVSQTTYPAYTTRLANPFFDLSEFVQPELFPWL